MGVPKMNPLNKYKMQASYNWCVHAPEERGDAVRFRGLAPFQSGDQGERGCLLSITQTGSIPVAGANYVERSSMAERILNTRVRSPSLTPISECRLAAIPLALGARFRWCKSSHSDHNLSCQTMIGQV